MRGCAAELLNKEIYFKIWLGCVFAGLVYYALPLEETFQFGGDENFEILKGFLYSRGFRLYTEIWNDQPPLFTVLLGALFKLTGPSVFAGRLMVLAFATILFVSFYSLVLRTSGRTGAIVAAICLLVSPLFLPFSVSVMQRIPALGMGLFAALLLLRGEAQGRQHWFLLSGIVMGCALQIRLTAAILLPALIIEVLLEETGSNGQGRFWARFRHLSIWFLGIGLSFSAILFYCGGISANFQTLKVTHFSTALPSEFGGPQNYPFDFGLLRTHIEVVIGTAFGICVILWKEHWKRMRLPFVFLITSVIVHLIHRPFWDYYYLHLLIPMVWISGHGVAQTFERASLQPAGSGLTARLKAGSFKLTGIGLCLLLAAIGGSRFAHDLHSLRERKKVSEDRILPIIMKYREGTHWFYTSSGLYAVYAQLPVPPEIAVVSLKRLWSGQITEGEIVSCVKRYQPEQLLLSFDVDQHPLWKSYVVSNYFLAYDDGTNALFVSVRLRVKASSANQKN